MSRQLRRFQRRATPNENFVLPQLSFENRHIFFFAHASLSPPPSSSKCARQCLAHPSVRVQSVQLSISDVPSHTPCAQRQLLFFPSTSKGRLQQQDLSPHAGGLHCLYFLSGRRRMATRTPSLCCVCIGTLSALLAPAVRSFLVPPFLFRPAQSIVRRSQLHRARSSFSLSSSPLNKNSPPKCGEFGCSWWKLFTFSNFSSSGWTFSSICPSLFAELCTWNTDHGGSLQSADPRNSYFVPQATLLSQTFQRVSVGASGRRRFDV